MLESDAYRRAESLATELKQLAHPVRILILAVLSARGALDWSQLSEEVRKHAGPVSPNALAYHIRALYRSGYLVRRGTPDNPVYEAANTAEIPKIREVAEAVRRSK